MTNDAKAVAFQLEIAVKSVTTLKAVTAPPEYWARYPKAMSAIPEVKEVITLAPDEVPVTAMKATPAPDVISPGSVIGIPEVAKACGTAPVADRLLPCCMSRPCVVWNRSLEPLVRSANLGTHR